MLDSPHTFLHRAVILGFPPLASLVRLSCHPVGDLPKGPLGFGGALGSLLLFACALLVRLGRGTLHCLLAQALVLGLPPRAQRIRLTAGPRQRFARGPLVLVLPPLVQLQGFPGGALLRFSVHALFLGDPALA